MSLCKPDPSEYGDAYAHYLEVAPAGDALALHQSQTEAAAALFRNLSEAQGGYRYAPGKWTLKDLLQHLTDVERIFAYRCLRLGRGDVTPLPGFEEDDYAASAQAEGHSVADLLADFLAVRQASLTLFRSLPEAAWGNQGTTSGKSITARCLPYIMLGHADHHLKVIRERYLPGLK
ncbi:DinB family protein [Geothrix sp. PMB-07]|uniref:DinB family protein n=1 Tax=Geothrix sp. PMB-07 TaxID=3068640 RepID=UPI00274297C5|nr:DinB family protein [Geothrix sp. PMB-07]WLT30015.1 DinB family protein [Geothrix sp. PMB-07]